MFCRHDGVMRVNFRRLDRVQGLIREKVRPRERGRPARVRRPCRRGLELRGPCLAGPPGARRVGLTA